MENHFTFDISLSVLNHLGRNLYRNAITILGEAISNSWDADAKNVWINIERNDNSMEIIDDGKGMTYDDFQNKFLKIGYSKRKNGKFKTDSGRPFIGRKGIGKLALLSCANRIHVISKTHETNFVGGIVDNSDLDKAIQDDINSQEYKLEKINIKNYSHLNKIDSGTYILFEGLNDGITNTVDYLKNLIALYFRFSLVDESFNIFVNNDKIDEKILSELVKHTQFIWTINDIEDPFLTTIIKNSSKFKNNLKTEMNIRGYIASVFKPSQLKIRGAEERITIDLFVNGRLREKDILKHIPTSRVVESYVYGQIHFDDLDLENPKDLFTSSREGVIPDDKIYNDFLEEIKKIFKIILDDWDELRRKNGYDGDPNNLKITPKARKAQELFNTTIKEMKANQNKKIKNNKIVENWIKDLSSESEYNIPSYVECFIAENLLRKYIIYNKMTLSKEAINEAKKWKNSEEKNKGIANISYDIRASLDDIYYLDMKFLSNFIDKANDKNKDPALSRSSDIYKPVRDAVGHTSLITPIAKKCLTLELENIKARVMKLMAEVK